MVFPRASLPEFGDGKAPSLELITIGSYPLPVTSPNDKARLVLGIP